MYHSFLIHSSADGYLGCFHVLAIINGIETYIISYMKQVASPGSIQDTGCLVLVQRRPRGMVQGGRRERGSGWGTHMYLWQIHVDVWQNQYNIIR